MPERTSPFKCHYYDVCGLFRNDVDSDGVDPERVLCILHSIKPDKDPCTFAQVLQAHRQIKGNIFAHMVFPKGGADFGSETFVGKTSFQEAVFEGEADFNGTKFEGNDANFQEALFKGKAGFIMATFMDSANFLGATFKGKANFGFGAKFEHLACFSNAKFECETNFRDATFGKADFSQATFKGEADFRDAKFEREGGFGLAIFKGQADFSRAWFKDGADFGFRAKFEDKANFQEAVFKGKTSFITATFKGEADFLAATFKDEANFIETKFEDKANFHEVDLTGTNFSNANLTGSNLARTNLTGVNLEGADLRGVYARYAIVDGETLLNTSIDKIDKETDFEGVGLDNARIGSEVKAKLKCNIRRYHWEGHTYQDCDHKGRYPQQLLSRLQRVQRLRRKAVGLFRRATVPRLWQIGVGLVLMVLCLLIWLLWQMLEAAQRLRRSWWEGVKRLGRHPIKTVKRLRQSWKERGKRLGRRWWERGKRLGRKGVELCRLETVKWLRQKGANWVKRVVQWSWQMIQLTWFLLIWLFWKTSDYGSSTLHLVVTFLIVSIIFSALYLIPSIAGLNPPFLSGLDELFCLDGNAPIWQDKFLICLDESHPTRIGFGTRCLRSLYFSVVTMTTLGFGDVRPYPWSIWGHVLVMLQVVIGYVLLGALITRLAIQFQEVE